jgi:para-aminobenzoate synthetase component 1
MRLWDHFIRQANQWGQTKVPFFFLIDFEKQKPIIFPLKEVDPNQILFDFRGTSNSATGHSRPVNLTVTPQSLAEYRNRFDKVKSHVSYGDSFLTNLTIRTPVYSDTSLSSLYHSGRARYKLLVKKDFVCFSPETFVRIIDNKIFSYPMKGTIDASVKEAEEKILNDPKEKAEHITIVDLIRNDLSRIATNVEVMRFRYLDKIISPQRSLWQVSSEITGELSPDFTDRLGDLLDQLLPAGSVSGAPKDKTLEIIREAEGEPRGYYTGVSGIFDGHNLDSAVLIRFIEQRNSQLYYRTGGGITSQSICELEYQETLDKIYVPLD